MSTNVHECPGERRYKKMKKKATKKQLEARKKFVKKYGQKK
jgi:hypothetical protein